MLYKTFIFYTHDKYKYRHTLVMSAIVFRYEAANGSLFS